MVQEQCFALVYGGDGERKCKALTMPCDGFNKACKFYKTRKQYTEDYEMCMRRIAELPSDVQTRIAHNLYNDLMPWSEYIPEEKKYEC